MIKREKMSSVDTAWLRMDRPAHLMMMTVLQCPRDMPPDPVIAERRIFAPKAKSTHFRSRRSSAQVR